jgi:hypothetical protein
MTDKMIKGFEKKIRKNIRVIHGFALNFAIRLSPSNRTFKNRYLSQGIGYFHTAFKFNPNLLHKSLCKCFVTYFSNYK